MKQRHISIKIPVQMNAKLENIVNENIIWKNKSQFIREAIIEKIRNVEKNFEEEEINQ